MTIQDMSIEELEAARQTAQAAWIAAYMQSIKDDVPALRELIAMLEQDRRQNIEARQTELDAKFEAEKKGNGG